MRVDSWYGVNGWPLSDTAGNIKNAFDRWPFTIVPGDNATAAQQLCKLAQFRSASSVVLIFDGMTFHRGQYAPINARHNGRTRTNVLYADGHAESVVTKEILALTETRVPTGVSGTLEKPTGDDAIHPAAGTELDALTQGVGRVQASSATLELLRVWCAFPVQRPGEGWDVSFAERSRRNRPLGALPGIAQNCPLFLAVDLPAISRELR